MEKDGISETDQYLTFVLDEEVFAVEIGKVREVLDFTTSTRVPRTPDYMRGVINLRGAVVPVVDMRLKFGMTATPEEVNTCIIIVEIDLEGKSTILGALADSVREVLDIDSEQIEPAPRIGAGLKTEFIKGMAKGDEGFVILLHMDKIFSGDELAMVRGGEVPAA